MPFILSYSLNDYIKILHPSNVKSSIRGSEVSGGRNKHGIEAFKKLASRGSKDTGQDTDDFDYIFCKSRATLSR